MRWGEKAEHHHHCKHIFYPSFEREDDAGKRKLCRSRSFSFLKGERGNVILMCLCVSEFDLSGLWRGHFAWSSEWERCNKHTQLHRHLSIYPHNVFVVIVPFFFASISFSLFSEEYSRFWENEDDFFLSQKFRILNEVRLFCRLFVSLVRSWTPDRQSETDRETHKRNNRDV